MAQKNQGGGNQQPQNNGNGGGQHQHQNNGGGNNRNQGGGNQHRSKGNGGNNNRGHGGGVHGNQGSKRFTSKPLSCHVTAFNTVGLLPTKSSFRVTTNELADIIRNYIATCIDGVVDVTYNYSARDGGHTKGTVTWFVWFDSNSDYFWDRRTMGNNVISQSAVRTLAKEFVEFAQKFGERTKGGKIEDIQKSMAISGSRNGGLAGLPIDISTIFRMAFDLNGNIYRQCDDYELPSESCDLDIAYEHVENRSEQLQYGAKPRYSGIAGCEITKYTAHHQSLTGGAPKPRPSGSFY